MQQLESTNTSHSHYPTTLENNSEERDVRIDLQMNNRALVFTFT